MSRRLLTFSCSFCSSFCSSFSCPLRLLPLRFVPEMIEVEIYRRLAESVKGRVVAWVEAPDAWYCKGATNAGTLAAVLTGAVIVDVKRIGKLLVANLSNGAALGLRFGMTGRLIVDGEAAVDGLLYSSDRNLPEWDRFRLHFVDGGTLAIRDPRRLGGVELNPDVSRLGPDAASISESQLRRVMRSRAPLKAVLLDQSRVAGIGNLLGDEILWRSALAPQREARSLNDRDVKELRLAMRGTITLLTKRGGSHTGDFMEHRLIGGRCPLDGTTIRHAIVGGRSTWWCEHHQV